MAEFSIKTTRGMESISGSMTRFFLLSISIMKLLFELISKWVGEMGFSIIHEEVMIPTNDS